MDLGTGRGLRQAPSARFPLSSSDETLLNLYRWKVFKGCRCRCRWPLRTSSTAAEHPFGSDTQLAEHPFIPYRVGKRRLLSVVRYSPAVAHGCVKPFQIAVKCIGLAWQRAAVYRPGLALSFDCLNLLKTSEKPG